MKLNRILLDPTAIAGGGTPAPVAPSSSATPAAKPSPPPATPSSAPAPTTPASDDPFEPPKKAPAAGASPSKPAAAAPAADDTDKLAPKELRERVKQLRAENQTYPGKLKALEDKIKEYESKGIDTTALTGRLSALEKERDAALADLRAARQEASPEFKEKYDKPFNQAAERAKKQITELTVVANAETGETRPANWADFVALYQLPVGKAIEQANAMFGTSANFVLQQREKLLDLDTARASALEEEKAQYKQRTEKEIAERATEKETVGKLWSETNSRLSEAVDDYKVDPTDTEAVEARKHALSVFDTPIQASNRQEHIQKQVIRDAHIRQKIGSVPVLKLKLTRAQEKITALEAQVAELKGTEPGRVQRPGGDTTLVEGDEDWAAGAIKSVKGV